MVEIFLIVCFESRCRKGSVDLLVNFDDLWLEGDLLMEVLSKYCICGKLLLLNYWVNIVNYYFIFIL